MARNHTRMERRRSEMVRFLGLKSEDVISMIAQEEGGLHHEERGCGNVCSNTGNCQPLGFIVKYSREPYGC